MRLTCCTFALPVLLSVLLSIAAAAAQNAAPRVNPVGAGAERNPQPQAKPLSPNSSVDEILDALDARGRNLREFVAGVSLSEEDQATKLESERKGWVVYQKQKNDDRIRATFDEKLEGRFAR